MNHKFQDANFNAKDTRYKIQDSRRGFTMVELVLVVGVLVVLSAVVLVTLQVPKYRGQAHNVQRKTDVRSMHNAFLLMARDKDDYTTGLPTSPTCIGTGSSSPFNLKGISWTVNPSDTAMKFNVRACTNATCSTNPSWGLDYNSPASIDIPNASYFQYKAAFNNVSDLAWTQGALGDPFDGTTASTTVSGGSVKLFSSITGDGSDNTFSVTTANTVVNAVATTASAATISAGTTSIAVSSTVGFLNSDEILIIQMYYSGDTNPASQAGKYEFRRLASSGAVSGSTLNFASGETLQNTYYGGATNKVQVVRVPQYTTVNISGSGSITANMYSSSTGVGGIVSFRAKSTVTIGGSGINVLAKGYEGGVWPVSAVTFGWTGQSYSGISSQCSSIVTSAVNYGGGGCAYSWCASGGGGAYGANGSNGNGPGGTTYGITDLSKIFLGSGGGSAARDAGCSSAYSNAGKGGGIVFIGAPQIDINSPVTATGEYGPPVTARGGMGGGGGGSVYLNADVLNVNNPVSATGGAAGTVIAGCSSICGATTNSGAGGRIVLKYRVKSGAGIISAGDGTISESLISLLSSGTYTSSVKDLNQPANFTTISWNRTDTNDGEITLGDANLKGLWHFNETSGTNAPDSAGANNLATNGATWSSSFFKFGGRSLSFNGTAYAQKTSPTGLDIGASDGSWTLEAWVKPTGTAAGTIISKDGAAMHYYDLRLDANNRVVAGLYDYNSTSGNYDDYAVAQSNVALSAGNWHHIAAVFTKSGSFTGTVQIYIDGKKDSNLASNSSLPSNMSNAAAFRIGQRNDGTSGFNGNIDEVAIWSKALTAPATDCATDEPKISYDSYQYEICQHYNKGIGIPHLKFQARSCASSCTTESYVGPDGTAGTYYNSIGSNPPLNLTANQWVQYKAYFATSDSSVTPSLDSISIRYNSSLISKPKLEDVTITASLDSAGKNQVGLLYSGYGDFYGGGTNLGQISPANSLKILDEGAVEYQGGSVPTYTSPIFSTQCFDIGPVLVPEYLPVVPKDPKIGTDQNTGYFFSANSEMGTVTISAPAAELGEVIRN